MLPLFLIMLAIIFTLLSAVTVFPVFVFSLNRLCGLVVRVPGYRSIGPVSIPGTTRFSE
jgi:hypothetical protein